MIPVYVPTVTSYSCTSSRCLDAKPDPRQSIDHPLNAQTNTSQTMDSRELTPDLSEDEGKQCESHSCQLSSVRFKSQSPYQTWRQARRPEAGSSLGARSGGLLLDKVLLTSSSSKQVWPLSRALSCSSSCRARYAQWRSHWEALLGSCKGRSFRLVPSHPSRDRWPLIHWRRILDHHSSAW